MTVNDGPNNTSTSFVVTVNPGSPTPTPTPTPTPPAGLVAAYSFNEGIGTTVTDASGNGITGNISRRDLDHRRQKWQRVEFQRFKQLC